MWVIIGALGGAAYCLLEAAVLWYHRPIGNWRRNAALNVLTALALMDGYVLLVYGASPLIIVLAGALAVVLLVLFFRIILQRPRSDA